MYPLATIRVDNFFRTFQLSDNSIVNCMIIDTPGAEHYFSLLSSYYKKADAILLVYDISEKKSFNKIKEFYVKEINDKCHKDIPILLLGNKTDKEGEREISYEEANSLALKENYLFKESSCLKYENVVEAFETLIERYHFNKININLEITTKLNKFKKLKK